MTQMFTYVTDLPYTDPQQNKNNFYKLSKQVLLPPYLANNPYFVDFVKTLDTVFDSTFEKPAYALSNIRNMWVYNQETRQQINNNQMIDFSQWGGPDSNTVAYQTNFLGLLLSSSQFIPDSGNRALAKFVGQYWYGKGKNSAVDFINFCLGIDLSLTGLWTQDYKTFVPQSAIPSGATYLWSSGRASASSFYAASYGHSKVGAWKTDSMTNGVGQSLSQHVDETVSDSPWYPTTHVSLAYDYTAGISTQAISQLFYEVANYNLVLYSVDATAITNKVTIKVNSALELVSTVGIRSPTYPIQYHSKVGGGTNGVGQGLNQISGVAWS